MEIKRFIFLNKLNGEVTHLPLEMTAFVVFTPFAEEPTKKEMTFNDLSYIERIFSK
jgi:hypothetical protein